MARHVVCTLFEGDYDRGAAALINSLHRSGFDGRVVCGHRGTAPSWAVDVARLGPITVEFVQMEHPHHLTYQKAQILERVIQESGDDLESVYYLDPDIVVKCDWPILRRWAQDGIALVTDVNGNIPERHPTRLIWRDWMADNGFTVRRELSSYYNAGFIGLPPSMAHVLSVWQQMIMKVEDHLGQLDTIKAQTQDGLFTTGDQDTLNMALETCLTPINAAGPEGMDFAHGGALLSHAIGTPKPWQARPLRAALQGQAPSIAHRMYLKYLDGPLQGLPARQANRLRAETRLAGMVGRVYRRA
jgi:hypothetical protein